ncbi:MAG: putative rane protein YcaP, family [Firmicutes bacterium]|nr:putative rane protein YcaP, family [Bacillota bacterium]
MDLLSIGNIILRTSFAFFVMLLLIRLIGRKQIAQLTFFDYVTGITVGSIAAVIAVDTAIPLLTGMATLVIWFAWIMAINAITLKSVPARKFIDGVPIMVVYDGKILEKNLGLKYYNVHDLLMQLRENGVFDPGEVQVAIAEANGNLSILKKSDYQPATVKDLNLPPSTQAASWFIGKELIIDGKIIEENLTAFGIQKNWLHEKLESQGICDVSQVLLATITPQGTLYLDKKKDTIPLNIH